MDSCVHGFHVYQGVWTTIIGEVQFSLPKRDNQQVCHSRVQDGGSCWPHASQDFVSMFT